VISKAPVQGRLALASLLLGLLAGPPVWAVGPTVNAGMPVQFLDLSTLIPLEWSWDFEYNGVPAVDSTERNPLWTFRFPGTYQVRLEVCNFAGCSVSVQAVQVELPPPLFADDFESGGVTAWSGASVGLP